MSEYLLAQGASLDIFSAIALCAAPKGSIALQKVDEVRSMVKANPNLLSQRLGFAHNEWQPLHFAVVENLLDMVQLLLDYGADIHARTAWGMTALCLAIHAKNEKVAKLLTERGAKVDLSAAIVSAQWQQARAILDADPTQVQPGGQNQLLLHYTVQQGLVESTKMILEYTDANIRTRHLFGDFVTNLTPLHMAALYGHAQVAVALLEHGAEVNAKDTESLEITPLHLAAMKGYVDMIRLLVEHGADLTLLDSVHGGTPLGWANHFCQDAAMTLLKQFGAKE